MNENELIADFMGVVFHDDENQYYDDNGLYIGEELDYHKSWEWLIPVVKAINLRIYEEELDYDVQYMEDQVLEDDKVVAYKEIIKFIRWYNKRKNPHGFLNRNNHDWQIFKEFVQAVSLMNEKDLLYLIVEKHCDNQDLIDITKMINDATTD